MLKAYRLFLLLGIASVMIASCGRNPHVADVDPVDLPLDTTLSELGDSSFIPRHVRCMDCSNDFLYYTDYAGGLVVLDKEYQVQKSLGARGQGPGEFLGAAHFYLAGNDSIYVLSEGKHSIEVFADNEHKQTIPFPEGARLTFTTRFLVNKGKVYHSVIHKDSPVVAFNNDTSVLMCSYTPFDDPLMGHHATKHVVEGDSSFFLIGSAYPTLEQYTMDGKLLKNYDLSVIPEIYRMMQAYRDAPKDPGTYFTVIQDVYYHDGNLFLLIGLEKNGKYRCNTVAVIDVSDVEWKYTECFHLSGKVYYTFCVDDEKIYAHDPSRACLDVFRLVNGV